MINKRSLKIFLISFCLTFLMTALPQLGFKTTWVSPMPLKRDDVMKKIQPMLELKHNDFKIDKQLIPTVSAGSDYDQAAAYAVVDVNTGQILAAKDLTKRLPMASLTKVMTAVVALDLAKGEDQFDVTQKAADQLPTKVMLKEGEKYSLNSLLEYALISSANDSAQVIDDGIDHKFGADTFVKAMNLKAQILGLKNSHFTNPQGYDNNDHFSSVEDLATMAVYALQKYPQIADIVSKPYDDLTSGGADMRFYLNNWNGLLGVYPGVSGLKIGNTQNAGYCTMVVSERGGKKLLAVLLGAPGVIERDMWTSELLDLGFNKIAALDPVNITEAQLKAKYASWKYFQ